MFLFSQPSYWSTTALKTHPSHNHSFSSLTLDTSNSKIGRLQVELLCLLSFAFSWKSLTSSFSKRFLQHTFNQSRDDKFRSILPFQIFFKFCHFKFNISRAWLHPINYLNFIVCLLSLANVWLGVSEENLSPNESFLPSFESTLKQSVRILLHDYKKRI